MKYQWLLLDADGTLFDYDRAEAVALERTFEQMGHEFQPGYAAAYRRINAGVWLAFERGETTQARLRTERFDRLFEAIGVKLDSERFSTHYLRNLAGGAYLLDGAEETIKALQGRVGLALITNGLADVQRPRLARSAIGQYFSALVISEEVGVAKPDPAIFEIAFERMGQPRKERVLIVGDSLTSDIQGGNGFGIDTCWFNPRQEPPRADLLARYEIGHLGELLGLLEITSERVDYGRENPS
jgi:YjjG family noncanonical pyrimidine nucleotidase